MNSFHERLYSPESEKLFAPIIPTTTQAADTIVTKLKSQVSDPLYTPPKNLTLKWKGSFAFQASASAMATNPNEHIIEISDGASIAIYKDAILFPEMCNTHLLESQYQVLFSLLDYGNGATQILPPDLTKEDAKNDFFSMSLEWLYLHEQAHLFQDHGTILRLELGDESNHYQFVWDEFNADSSAPVVGREAWIRHAFEISADYEATNLLIQHVLTKNKKQVTKTTLWILTSALTCIFHRFYGKERPLHGGEAVGTHPDPAYRMRYAFSNVINTLSHPDVKPYAPWASTAEDIRKVMLHAFNAANIYMQVAHFQEPAFPQFMSRMADNSEESKKYRDTLKATWNELHPKVLEKHFGWGHGCVMSFI